MSETHVLSSLERQPTPNHPFGRYQIEAKLGVGGMATVYRAYDPVRQEHVALKILHYHWAEQADIVGRFQREAEIAASLQHPHIVPVYEYGEIDGRPYLAMEYMPYGSLSDQFQNPTHINLLLTTNILRQIASALDYAHEQGIIHRDLKLENILLRDDEQVALSDFGIARVIDATRITVTGNLTGTPVYMSPEQARGQQNIDHRSDLYSFAVMAYLMVTGHYPFTGDDVLGILSQHLTMNPPPPTQVNPMLPSALDEVLLRGLAKNPANRFESAQAFVADFEKATRGCAVMHTLVNIQAYNPIVPVAIALTGLQDTLPIGAQKKARRPRFALWAAVVTALSALFLFGAALLSGRNAEDPVAIAARMLTETAAAWTATLTITPSPTLTSSATPSSTPSETPGLTLTPDPSAQPVSFGLAEVNQEGLRLHLEADERSVTSDKLTYRQQLMVVGRDRGAGWLQVRTLNGVPGWIPADRVTTTIDVDSLPVTWVSTAGGMLEAAPTSEAKPGAPSATPSSGQQTISSGGAGQSTYQQDSGSNPPKPQPTQRPPTSEPPTSEPPTSEPPTSEPPTNEPPTNEPPTSEPPTSEPPPVPGESPPQEAPPSSEQTPTG